jgi:hypothetical protein
MSQVVKELLKIENALPKNLVKSKRNLIEVVNKLPQYGIGYKVVPIADCRHLLCMS